jgi:hypothetical protein
LAADLLGVFPAVFFKAEEGVVDLRFLPKDPDTFPVTSIPGLRELSYLVGTF